MDNDNFLSIFEKDAPIYICPWCNSLGKYDRKEELYYDKKDRCMVYYLVARCLKCKQYNKSDNGLKTECSCVIKGVKDVKSVDYSTERFLDMSSSDTLCKKHRDAIGFTIRIYGRVYYDIIGPHSNLLEKKQLTNIARFCNFIYYMLDADEWDAETGIPKIIDYKTHGKNIMSIPVSEFSTSQLTNICDNILSDPHIIQIYRYLINFNIPLDLIRVIYKLIIVRELFGII